MIKRIQAEVLNEQKDKEITILQGRNLGTSFHDM